MGRGMCPAGNVINTDGFLRAVAHPTSRGNKDHSHRTEQSHMSCIVARAEKGYGRPTVAKVDMGRWNTTSVGMLIWHAWHATSG